MAEFNANATSLVGNFMGPCLIHLNGESITIKRSDRLEIAKWPYIVIRQFRAEEEQGRFSFVSGRRGPYGVAEYNFALSKSMLTELQEALTQFTGAKFSTVAPGSGSGENPPPIPTSHRPPYNNPLHPSPSIQSINSVGGGSPSANERGRSSVGSESGFSSYSLTRAGPPPVLTGPRLPPRDYLPSYHQQGTPPPTRSDDGRYIRSPGGYHRTSDGSEYNIVPDRTQKPPSPPVQSQMHDHHTSTRSPRNEAWVLKSSTYETRKQVPTPKPGMSNGVKGRNTPPLHEERDTPQELPKLPPKYIPASQVPPTEDTPTTEPKKDGYDRLTSLGQEGQTEQVPPAVDAKHTDSTNLDFASRSSPLLRAKSPEEAQLLHHLRSVDEEGDIIINSSPTIRGRRSPEDRLKRSQTDRVISPSHQTYDVPGRRMVKQFSADEVRADSHYHVPKPTPPSRDIEYRVPRPYDDSRNRRDYYHQPKASEETYKVPKPYTQSGADTYDSPKNTPQSNAQPLYNTPKAMKEELVETENFYTNISKNGHGEQTQDNLYNVPKAPIPPKAMALLGITSNQEPANLYSEPGPTKRRAGSEKKSKFSASDIVHHGPPPMLHKLRSARSAESLFTRRINHIDTKPHISPPNDTRPHISPPNPTNKHNMYVDIEKNGQVPTAENLYAEIPANHIPRMVQLTSNGGESAVPQPTESSRTSVPAVYDVPTKMNSQIQKQRKLAREGYELCLPAEANPDSLHMMTLPGRGKQASASPPTRILRDHRGSCLDKYDIHMPSVRATRPRSEADILDSVEKSSSTHNEDILGSSIPANSTLPITDEYVIITHRDTRPKFPPTQPQGIPGSSKGGTQVTNESTDGQDEYQTMTGARVDRAKFLYDTPNPSASGNGRHSNMSQTDNQQNLVQDVKYETVTSSHLDSESSLDMEGVSPRRSRPCDYARSSSFSSRGSVFSDQDPEVEGHADHVIEDGVAIPQRVRMRIASGSPRDATSSMEIKSRSRSLGNVLDAAKKHSYVNVKEDDTSSVDQDIKNSTLATAAQKKPPMPLPKPSVLTTQQVEVQPMKCRHGYESVNMDQVKGNSHPLSSSSTSSM